MYDMKAYLDHNLLCGLAKSDLPAKELDALKKLVALHKKSKLDLRISEVHSNELALYKNLNMKKEIQKLFIDFSDVPMVVEDQELLGFHSQWTRQGGITWPLIEDDPTSLKLRSIISGRLPEKADARTDAHHLMLAIKAACERFVTLDIKTILNRKVEIEKEFPQIRLVKPSELLNELTSYKSLRARP